MPAGKHIKTPRKKTRAIVPFGSLNLSDRKKYKSISIEGLIVINRVLIFSNLQYYLHMSKSCPSFQKLIKPDFLILIES